MNPTRPDLDASEPLTADERAWAERLARIGPHGGPPPALDASILAAAHAAASTRHPTRHVARWPALLGVAATLALAVGVAWQLRPLATAPEVQHETPSPAAVAMPAVTSGRADEAEAPATASTEAGDIAAQPAPTLEGDVGTAAAPRLPQPANVPARTRDFGVAPPVSPQPVVAPYSAPAPTARDAAPEPMAFPAPAPPAPPPPAARAAKATATTQDDAVARPRLDRSAAMPQQDAAAESMAGEATAANRATAAATTAPELPDVAEDRELAPSDWLQRVRLRRDLGDTTGARESLALFRRTHPGIAIPADLRPFDTSQAPEND